MSHFQSYIICTSPRSGSTLLCHLLRQTGMAGCPESYFHAPSLAEWLAYYGLASDTFETSTDATRAVFSAAVERGKGGTDVFGLRLQRHSFDFFAAQLGRLYPERPDDKSRLEAAFGKTLFLHLTRKDKLEQAISYVKARQSGLWHRAPDGTELERLSEPQELVYDHGALSRQRDMFRQMDQEWHNWFAARDIEPLTITYEALAADPPAALSRVLSALGVEHDPDTAYETPVAKLADATNRDWAARFRALSDKACGQ